MHVYHGNELARYGFGAGHPFGPDRLDAFWQETLRQGLDKRVTLARPVLASEAEIARFHTADYLARVKQQSQTGTGYLDWGDTPAFEGVFEAAAYVVGSTLDAVRQSMNGTQARAFVPIGGLHHARRDSAAGFCVFNDIGVAIESLRIEFGVRRIAYVDIDAHHGDGVFYAYEDDPEVFIADIHEDGHYLYPGSGTSSETGKGTAKGTKLNLPMAPGADDRAFHEAWPFVEDFVGKAEPEIILLQCGADSVAGDPITHMQFSPECHGHAAHALARIAEKCCEGRVVAMGGGGYDRRNLALAWNAVVKGLLDSGTRQ